MIHGQSPVARNHVSRHGAPSPLRWFLAAALFVALLALLVGVQLFQITSEGPAKDALRQSTVALTEIDLLLALHYDALRETAEISDPGEALSLRDYPIDITFTREDVISRSQDDLRALILARSADALYADGTGVLRDDAGTLDAGRFTAAGSVDSALTLLRDRAHDIFAILTFLLAVVCAALVIALALAWRGIGWLTVAGAALLAASLLLLGAAGVVWLYMNAASDGNEFLRRELLDVGATLALIPLRNGVAFAALGALMMGAGIIGARLTTASEHTANFANDR
jgi:hypothetical protein